MTLKIIKVYRGTNIIKARTPSGLVRFGYRWTHERRKYQKARWATRAEAETELTRLKARLLDPTRHDWQDSPLTLERLLAAWLERARKQRISIARQNQVTLYVGMFARMTRRADLRMITANDLTAYQAARLSTDPPTHPHSVNKETKMIRAVLRAAPALFPGYEYQPPKFDLLPSLHNGRQVTISREQLAQIIFEMTPTHKDPDKHFHETVSRDAVLLAIQTAMRISEIVGLEKSRVQFQRGIGYKQGSLAVTNAKTGKLKTIPMTQTVARMLRRRIDENPGRYLFKPEDEPVVIAAQRVRRHFKSACKRAGVPYGQKTGGAVFHTLRHSTTTHLLNRKLPLAQVMEITGHSRESILLIYSHTTSETREEATDALEFDPFVIGAQEDGESHTGD